MQLQKELMLLGRLFKRASNDATNRMNQIRMIVSKRMESLQKQRIKKQEFIKKLQLENFQLLEKIKTIEVNDSRWLICILLITPFKSELQREFQISTKEKNDIRCLLKILHESVDTIN